MKSSREKENDRGISSHVLTLHRRLLHALNLGTRYFDEKTNRWKWQCANIEVQKNVLRSINAFLDSISADARAVRHTIVKYYKERSIAMTSNSLHGYVDRTAV